MANTSLYDSAAALQVIGCAMNNPSLLTNSAQYEFFETDFITDIHRVIFGAMYELARTGTTNINVQTIDNFLKEYPESYGIWLQADGPKICSEVKLNADKANFDYYYERLKKFALLRAYEDAGLDTSRYYDLNNILDPRKRQEAQQRLDQDSLAYIANQVEYDIVGIRGKHVDNSLEDGKMIGEDLDSLIYSLKEEPLIGLPLFDPMMNVVTRGARLGTFYLRSAASGVGKSRSMLADACFLACDEYYNCVTNSWEPCGASQPTLFISTELDLQELQTMALAFITGINEDLILNGQIDFDLQDRIQHGIEILMSAPLKIELAPNFTVKTIENMIRRYHTKGVNYFYFDYLGTSLGIIEEISKRTRGMAMREDTVLFLFATKLKELAVELDCFIFSSTQLSAEWKTDSFPDQNLLRGAKSLADAN